MSRAVVLVLGVVGALLLLADCGGTDTKPFEELQQHLRPAGAVDNLGCRTHSGKVTCSYSVPASAREVAISTQARLEHDGYSAFGALAAQEFEVTSPDGKTRVVFSVVDGPLPASFYVRGKKLREAVPPAWSQMSIRISRGGGGCEIAIDCVKGPND
jgi:hypothetical protein